MRSIAFWALALTLSACTFAVGKPTSSAQSGLGLRAEAWPEAEGLFRRSERWLGGDAASSIDLGRGRILWMFGDSFVADRIEGDRTKARMIHNSVALQSGYDPMTAPFHQYWGFEPTGPEEYFKWPGEEWLWPLHGIRIGQTITIFCARARKADNLLGFVTVGWVALRGTNPDVSPHVWQLQPLAVPALPSPVLGGVSVIRKDGFVLAYAVPDGEPHDAFLMRWPEPVFVAGNLAEPEWWVESGWIPQRALTGFPAPVMRGVAAEFSVSEHPSLGFVQVQSLGFPVGDLAVRFAPRPEGPWSEPRVVYRPPEGGAHAAMVYAGKAHPELKGATLVATYVASSMDIDAVLRDQTRYFPRFVRLNLP
jgi:hypothetical protein